MGCSNVKTSRLGGDCEVFTTRANKAVEIKTSLICSINIMRNYVKVEPKYIWLTESNNYMDIVNVYSDVKWEAK